MTVSRFDLTGRTAFVTGASRGIGKAVAVGRGPGRCGRRRDRSAGTRGRVVNNAGGSNFMVGFRDLRLSGWDKLMRLNLDSAMYVCHAFAGRLLDRRHGSIINVAPVAGGGLILAAGALRRSKGRPDLADEIAGRRMGRRRLLVNALCPGWTATDLNRNLGEDPAASPATVATVTLRRWGTAEEMARAAVFLASDAASS